MATVYLAHDLRHDRTVALKVLPPELAASLGPERFLREIGSPPGSITLTSSACSTPVKPRVLWYTMPYVDGETLRDRLRREGQLPVEDALRITSEVADALDYAHRAGWSTAT